MPAVLLEEVIEQLLRQARDKDRLVVRNQLNVEKPALKVKHHKHVDRCAGEAGQRCHRFGLKDIARLGAARVQ